MNIFPIMMKSRVAAVLGVWSVLLLVTGCQTLDTMKSSLLGPEKRAIVSLEDTPLESKAVTSALLMRLHGDEEAFIDDAISVKNASVFPKLGVGQLEGWKLHGLDIRDAISPQKIGDATEINGIMYLRDQQDRGLTIAFMSAITETVDGYDLKSGHWRQIAPSDPRTELYIVPLAILDDFTGNNSDYFAFHSFVQKNAISLEGSNPQDKKESDYAIFVFLKDLLLPDDQFFVKISDVRDGTDGYGDLTSYQLFDDGWVAAMIKGRFTLSDDLGFWIKAVYVPKNANARIIGLYSADLQQMPSS